MSPIDPIEAIEAAAVQLFPDAPRIEILFRPVGQLPCTVTVHREDLAAVVSRIEDRPPTPAEEALLDMLRAHPGLTAKQITTRLRVTYSYARKLLARAKRKGLIFREKTGYVPAP